MLSHFYDEDLAYIHHAGFGELARAASVEILRLLERTPFAKELPVVELGCGSGILLAQLEERGYRTSGVDASAAMLRTASEGAPSAELRCASLYETELPPCAAVLAVGEGLNYVDSPTSVPRVEELFSRIAGALRPGGLLIFDVMIEGRVATRSYRSWSEGSDWAVLVEISLASASHLKRSITMFRLVDGAYRRSHEDHYVYLFSRALLTGLLRKAGFRVRTRLSYGQYRLGPGRIVFQCRRRRA
jgi:SAM-dependent methyltransferase